MRSALIAGTVLGTLAVAAQPAAAAQPTGAALAVGYAYALPDPEPPVPSAAYATYYASPGPPGTSGLDDPGYAPEVAVQYPHQDTAKAWKLAVNPAHRAFRGIATTAAGSDEVTAEVGTDYRLDVPGKGTYATFDGVHSTSNCTGSAGGSSTELGKLRLRQPGGELSDVDVPAGAGTATAAKLDFPPPNGEADSANPHFGDLTVRRVLAPEDLIKTPDLEPGYLRRAAGWRIDVVTYRADGSDRHTESVVLGAAAC